MTQQVKSEPVFVQAETYTKRYVKCPICKDKTQGFHADHLLKDAKPNKPCEAGPWQCDRCNNRFNFKVHVDGRVDIAQTFSREAYVPCLVLLKTTHEEDPVYFMLNTKAFQDIIDLEKKEPGTSFLPYRFNEHSCPTNFINDTIRVAHQGDTDPHGVFEFVRMISIPDALALAKAHHEEFELDNYDSIDECDIRDAFRDHMELLFPESIMSGNDYEGSIIETVGLPILQGSYDKLEHNDEKE